MEDAILFDTLRTASGHAFGRATLNAPATLNALSLPMIDRLDPQLVAWGQDPEIAGVVLDAVGDRAFCAGGDVVALHHAICAASAGHVPEECSAFFEREYRLDYRIHTFPKPILCWGHGIVMGGGIGLMAGASHRVATSRTHLAMPEIGIGLYPDVGASWFLPRMPGRSGLFLALTGAPLNGSDAKYVGLADVVVPHETLPGVLDAVSAERWQGEQAADAARLSHLLDRFVAQDLPASNVLAHLDRIDAAIGHDRLEDVAPRLAALASDADPWLAQAGSAFVKGSPTSAALSFEMQRRARHLSLADVFRLEYQASVGCCVHHDFAEGVRALLVDKDKNPRWQPAAPGEVGPELIDAHLQPRFDGPHPLSDLR
jgi:enoyl-CoA hydratase/carnithine racemase